MFPCKADKSPYPTNGFYSATTDASELKALWEKHPDALVGVWAGASNLCVLDIDLKRNQDGEIVTDGYTSLDDEWLDIPETFSYTTLRGEGEHRVYAAPKSVELSPAADYRGMKGVDRRAGGSYVVWTGDVPGSTDVFSEAPQWLCDASEARSVAAFEGTVKDWYDSLETGDPNVLVRKAIARVKDDFSHSDMVEAQHEAIRLGAEGNPGVPELLTRLEEAWLNRPGENHTTPETQWEYKFAEALESGIKKHGEAIELRQSLPTYDPGMIPASISNSLVTGLPGDKGDFNSLLRAMVAVEDDDLVVTSVMWSAPKVRELSHEWGLQFVNKRVREARTAPPPATENPTIPEAPTPSDALSHHISSASLLTEEEIEHVLAHPTFIDEYVEYSKQMKGWVAKSYAVPAAWTMLSMAFGFKAFLPKGRGLPINLWFLSVGESGTGKTSEFHLLETCLNLMHKQPEETYFNLGASSSPEAMHEALLERDKKPSMVLHDEASDFFENLQRKDWMSGLKDNYSKWYDGYVPPVNKVRLKELKGKSAQTSFGVTMLATPDRLFKQIDTTMFESGFLARFNWIIAEPVDKGDQRRFMVHRTNFDEEGTPPVAYDIVSSLLFAIRAHKAPKTSIDWTDEAEDVLVRAHIKMDEIAQSRDHYETTDPAVTRLGSETTWKCAALLAMYRGDRVIQEIDALTAVFYAQQWLDAMFRVVEAAGNGEFAVHLDDMEKYIRRFPKGVTEPKVYDRFKGMAKFSRKDVDNVIDYLIVSGRILRDTKDPQRPKYLVNGG